MTVPMAGVCQYCSCHGEACTLANGEKCVWYDAGRTVCNAPGCVRAALARARANAPVKSKYAGWGFGAILEDLQKQRRGRRRRKKAA